MEANWKELVERVKVYRLNENGKWDDRGTGHVTVDYLERSEELGLFVIDEEDNETLLAHRISSDEIYRRQEETIISWRDPEYSTELALSFQETPGCSYIWDHICSVQRNMQFNTLSNLEMGHRSATEALETSGTSQANDESFHGVNSELRELPAVELSTLPLILKTVVESGITDQIRVTELIVHDQDFFRKLMDLFRICEDLENIEGLHMIFKIVKGIILLNNPQIFEKIFGDELIMDIIGSLEYDPEIHDVQHHRAFLKEHVVFKEAIPIKDPEVLSKIHQTYRIGYIKDVILPRVLDEATVANLNSVIHAHNAVVVSLLKDDSTFIQELFAKMRSPTTSPESKKNLACPLRLITPPICIRHSSLQVFFLHEFCSLSRSLQLVQQLRLFRDLMNEGIFDIITDALRSPDKRLVLTGTDILILFLNQDPNLLRSYVIRQEGNPLLGLLVKGMITDFGEDMHCQFLEILRSLLDSYTLSGSQRDNIIEIFYEKHLDQLIDVITLSCPLKGGTRPVVKSTGSGGSTESQAVTKPEIFLNICELLCFCVLHHPYRIKCNFLLNNVIEKVLFLTRRRERYLVVAAVRFLRTIISRNDDHLLRHIVKNNLLKPIVEAFVANGNRYNLLHSAVLELFDYIRKENLKTLITYVVNSFWNQLAKFEHLPSIQALKVKYEQSLEACETRSAVNVVDPRKRNDARALEKEEEDYFNEDSDEEDTASVRTSHTRDQCALPVLPNGSSISYPSLRPGSGGLVDYDDDDDDEDYNPPPKPGTSGGDSREADSLEPKRKSNSKEEELELTKKQRLDKNSKDGVVSTISATPSHAASHGKKVTGTMRIITRTPDTKSSSDQENHVEKEPTAPRSCSNCVPNASGTRQSSGDDCPLMAPNSNNSPSELAVNGTNVTGSEPYSVR
ncbi:serine/threonine-protein phosphatase 4 regulatory subunit 3-like isoform X1 [Macadamia integrifolia]|uniref:serine/threonine-protein phosphatase 4 regulatory subunit 3-like isoform X1 n=1 Tax=Macadamia integrifolia TaxID=60698 RepID=UPI001C4F9117|nr:serine/threonine-protein phosphatase 4 regulatory subunit 3-like isoform X1 [Macadamia integrifolia]